jgi:hypothetical protein
VRESHDIFLYKDFEEGYTFEGPVSWLENWKCNMYYLGPAHLTTKKCVILQPNYCLFVAGISMIILRPKVRGIDDGFDLSISFTYKGRNAKYQKFRKWIHLHGGF